MIQLLTLLDNIWSMQLKSLNWELLKDSFLVKALNLYKRYPLNNCLHIKLSSILKSIISFLLKECESFSESELKLEAEENKSENPNPSESAKFLEEALTFISKDIISQYQALSRREKYRHLYKGFIIQLCRLIFQFEKRNHRFLKNLQCWRDIVNGFLFLEMKKEDRVLIEDPKNKLDKFKDNIALPHDFKFNDGALRGKMNLNFGSNYDSIGDRNIIIDEKQSPENISK